MKLKCPHCGNDKFFYQKMRYSGEWYFEVNNQGDCDETCDNSDMYQDVKSAIRK